MSHGESSHVDDRRGLGPRFQEALVYGAELHRLQTRKGTSIPYVGHLLIVAGTVIEWGGDEDQAIAATLHDAVEDQGHSGETSEEIRRRFGDRVAAFVEGLSDTDEVPKPPWKERKKAYFDKLKVEPPEVVLISAADKLHNARAILSDFVDEGDRLWERFSVKGRGGLPQLWYYRELLKVYEQRLPTRVTRDLRVVVEELAACMGQQLNDIPEPE
jgi:(p)ppGpp synthase/HD superfamily hydrolase